jgi:YVTN family beta-propeller protein
LERKLLLVSVFLLITIIPVEANYDSSQTDLSSGPNVIPAEANYLTATSVDTDDFALKDDQYSLNASAYDPTIPHIDTGLKAMIDAKIDSDVDGTKYYRNTWSISRSEYKAWIALIALQEGGNFGYGAHSGSSTDSYHHVSGQNFYFSTGLGAFQLDRGGVSDSWSKMPSIDKLDPEKSLESTLKYFYNTYTGTEDLSYFEKHSVWFGVASGKEAVFKPIWQAMTGHTWDECKNAKLDVNFSPSTFDAPYSKYVTYVGKIHWNPHNGMFDKDLDTWLITAGSYRATGNKYQYYYTYDSTTGWESWVLNDADKKYIYRFDRNYASTYLPNPLTGVTDSSPAFNLNPVDIIFLIDTTGSMWDDINSVKSSATEIVEALYSKNCDYRVCIADYRDYPVYPYGQAGTDYVYKLDLPFSNNKDQIINSINGISLGNGVDWQESVYSALVNAISDSNKDSSNNDNYGWRKGVTKCIIIMGDAPPHTPEPWSGGYSLDDVVYWSKHVDPVAVYSIRIGSDESTYDEFSEISNSTGGNVYTADGADDLVDTILKVIEDIEPESSYAYITNTEDNTVSVIDTATNTVASTVSVGLGSWGVGVNPDGTKVYVANRGSGTVSVIDTATNKVTATLKVGNGANGVAVTSDGTKVYVTNINSNNSVSVIDTATNKVTGTFKVGKGASGVAVTPNGKKVYVVNSNSNSVSVIDTVRNKVTATLNVKNGASGVAVTPDGTKAYVTSSGFNSVSVIDTDRNKVTATLKVGKGASGIAVAPDGTKVYVANRGDGTVSVIDTATNKVTSTVSVGNYPFGVSVTSDGTKVYVVNSGSNSVSVIDTATNKVTATVLVGRKPIAFGQFISL